MGVNEGLMTNTEKISKGYRRPASPESIDLQLFADDDTTPGQSQADALSGAQEQPAADPNGSTPTQDTADAANVAGGGESESNSVDPAYIKKLREEAKGYRLELKKVQDTLKERELAEMSEVEKAKAQAQEAVELTAALRKQLEEQAKLNAVQLAANEQTARPEFVTQVLMASPNVMFDIETGTVTGVDTELKTILDKAPELKRKGITPTATDQPPKVADPTSGPTASELEALNTNFIFDMKRARELLGR